MTSFHLTFRDVDLLTAVERCPLTVRQLRALSVTFRSSFGSDRRLQDRLAILTKVGLFRRFRYAETERPGQYYYTLSPEGFRLLNGEAGPGSPGLFREIGVARQHHAHKLADFVVHTLIGAHACGVSVKDFTRENALRLTAGDDHLYPDTAFTLVLPDDRQFLFYVELDNSTEPLASPRERDSWLRKLQFYERLQDQCDNRFRVLAVTTKSGLRTRNLLTLAASVAKNPKRALLYSVYLPEYLEAKRPLTEPIFLDHRGLHLGLVPSPVQQERQELPDEERPLANPVPV